VEPRFDENNVWMKAFILAYSQIRELEDLEWAKLRL
jgi:hypothetical protein